VHSGVDFEPAGKDPAFLASLIPGKKKGETSKFGFGTECTQIFNGVDVLLAYTIEGGYDVKRDKEKEVFLGDGFISSIPWR